LRTNVYIDGLNLYYGALKNTPYKWLDVSRLCQLLLPRDQIQTIKYFTAVVRGWAHDPDAPTRQQIYLRALRTIPNLYIYYGHFLSQKRWIPLAASTSNPPECAEVIRTDEKGSDVNLATHLLWDAFRGEFEQAVLVTNDSDLLEPIRIVREELGLPVGILNPHPRTSRVLLPPAVNFVKRIRSGPLSASQFPNQLRDQHGAFTKPPAW
jgi:uncharacterized LabA/DUF88 family protein